jgi:hypothetical protein
MLTEFALLLLAPAGPPAWKELLDRIEAMAFSEPPVLAVDTRIRAAKVLTAKQPAEARRLLDDAAALTYSFTDARTRALLFTDIYQALQPVSREAADELASALPLQAFTADALVYHLRDTLKRDPESAALEFSTLMAAFPSNPTPGDVRQLMQFTHAMGGRAPEITKQAVAKARAALKDRRFKASEEARDALSRDLAAVASGAALPDRPREKQGDDPQTPDIQGLDESEVVALARKQAPLAAAAMLLELLDDNKPLAPPARRAAIAREALELTAKIPPCDDRLMAQSMLTRRLYQYGDRDQAAIAARMLQESFRLQYDCESAACTSIRLEETPGQPISDFADYLLEHKIRPADLGLQHVSLDARVAIADLDTLLNGSRKRLSFF